MYVGLGVHSKVDLLYSHDGVVFCKLDLIMPSIMLKMTKVICSDISGGLFHDPLGSVQHTCSCHAKTDGERRHLCIVIWLPGLHHPVLPHLVLHTTGVHPVPRTGATELLPNLPDHELVHGDLPVWLPRIWLTEIPGCHHAKGPKKGW